MLLRSVAWRHPLGDEAAPAGHPFDVPVVRALVAHPLEFTTPVTFLVGENGSGKSTLLEAVACAAGSIAVGAQSLDRDPTLASARALADRLRLVWSRRTRAGCFLRAEDVFGYVRAIEQLNHEVAAELKAVHEGRKSFDPGDVPDPEHRPWLGGDGRDFQSHGEAFLDLLATRVRPGGLHLLDEPEAPLSPTRQLTLLAMVGDAAAAGGQFVIATHSPILMALPGATILQLGDGPARPVAWDDVEHVSVTRAFLNSPEAFLRHLGSTES